MEPKKLARIMKALANENRLALYLEIAKHEQADFEDPKDHRYELAVRRVRFVAAQAHVDQGRRLREQGQLEEALAHFQHAMTLDPSLTVAAQQYRRTRDVVQGQAAKPTVVGKVAEPNGHAHGAEEQLGGAQGDPFGRAGAARAAQQKTRLLQRPKALGWRRRSSRPGRRAASRRRRRAM